MDTLIENLSTSGFLRVCSPLLVVSWAPTVPVASPDEKRSTNVPRLDYLPCSLNCRMMPKRISDQDFRTLNRIRCCGLSANRCQYRLGFLEVPAHRFFTKHVLARLKGRSRDLGELF